MPQISKIRIVNFQYNEGRRLIADELYDLESTAKAPQDVLINLENGGGKSVLVQLMMQPVIPRAKVAGRRIESFFTRASDHCYVVLEWALDNSRMKLMTGIAMSASDASADYDAERGFQIKYYTFISDYQDYKGIYNIINLPLSRKENGKYIPAAFDDIRNLARKSNGGLLRYASDDSVKWRDRLAQYGIIQNEWHLIEKLNSSEGGLDKYFSSIKSSDTVVDELIIPRIEEKQSHSTSRDDSSLETMLISYARQFGRQQDIIKERQICDGFCLMLEGTRTEAEELWRRNDSFEKCVERLFAYSDAIGAEIDNNTAQAEKNENERTQLDRDIRHIEWEKLSAGYYALRKAFETADAALRSAEEDREAASKKAEAAGKRVLLIQCADYYAKLKEINSQLAAVSTEIYDRENDSKDRSHLASLKYSAYMAIKAELERIAPELIKVSEDRSQSEAKISELDRELSSIRRDVGDAKTESDRTAAVLDRQIREDDKLVDELGIDATRMLDGRYQEAELKNWQGKLLSREQEALKEIGTISQKLQDLELRKEAIPQEIADAGERLREIIKEEDELNHSLEVYRLAEADLKAVLDKHGLDHAGRFTSAAGTYINEHIAAAKAEIEDVSRRIEACEEKKAAVGRGTLHIPKLLLQYLDRTGLHYMTVEKYILTLQEKGLRSREECRQFLERYPYAAYGVKVEEADRKLLYQEASTEWLPAVLPVFTDADIEKLLSGKAEVFSAVAAYAEDYFMDSRAYTACIEEEIKRLSLHRVQLEEREKALQDDSHIIDAFSAYDENWENRNQAESEKLKLKKDAAQKIITDLKSELETIREQIALAGKEEKKLQDELGNLHGRLSEFEKLMARFCEEEELSRKYDEAQKKLRELSAKERKSLSEKESFEDRLKDAERRSGDLEIFKELLEGGLRIVAETKAPAEAELIEDGWEDLLNQYKTMAEAQSTDLKNLYEKRDRLLKEQQEKNKEIGKRSCSKYEYENIVYSEEAERDAVRDSSLADKLSKEAEELYNKEYRAQGIAEADYNTAADRLSEFGGEALPADEIGNAFETRISEIRLRLTELSREGKLFAEKRSVLQKAQAKAENAAEDYKRPAKVAGIELEADYAAQLAEIIRQLRKLKAEVSVSEQRLEGSLRKMSEKYSTASTDVSLAIGSMRELISNTNICGDRYYTLCEHIDANLHTAKLRISQIDTDLKEFHRTKADLIHQCLIQGRQMYEGLTQLSANSKVKVQDKRRQMLKFDIPDSVDENAARANITAEIDKGTEEIAAKITGNDYAESDIRKMASHIVGSRRLLRRYINQDNIVLKAYKIDSNPDNSGYRTWEQTQVNSSGAERFVVYFAMLLSLIAYTRDGYDDMDGENRSVLVLDNPFGPISSRHMLEPMFEISRKYKVQMICLSNISNSDVVNCFNLVIRAVVKRFALSSREQLTHEGNELIEHGFYSSEQFELFQ